MGAWSSLFVGNPLAYLVHHESCRQLTERKKTVSETLVRYETLWSNWNSPMTSLVPIISHVSQIHADTMIWSQLWIWSLWIFGVFFLAVSGWERKFSDGKKRANGSLVWLWIKRRVEDTTVHLLISKNDIHHRSLSPLQWFRGVFLLQDYHRQITSNTTGLDWDNAEVTFEKAANLQTTWGGWKYKL